MYYDRPWIQKIRFGFNLTVIYVLTIAFAWYAIQPHGLFDRGQPVSITRAQQQPRDPGVAAVKVIAGLPVRIVIPGSSLDLPVDEGYYDSSTDSWTLSGYHAQFAMVSTLANNVAGETYIYGHNNDYVFGALRHVTPAVGAQALVYTANGHIFSYTFVSASSVAPDITSVLTYNGPPIMTIQTCTGSFNELRTLYKFNFDKVVQ